MFGGLKIIEASFDVQIGDPGQWRLKRALSGGGALMDVGIYALQAARYISGEEPIEVRALEGKTNASKYAEVDESMLWQMRFPSGAVANCSTSYETAYSSRIRVHAEKGWFGLEPAFGYRGNKGRSQRRKGNRHFRTRLVPELRWTTSLGASWRTGESKVSGEEGLRDVKIMMAIYEAARTGRAFHCDLKKPSIAGRVRATPASLLRGNRARHDVRAYRVDLGQCESLLERHHAVRRQRPINHDGVEHLGRVQRGAIAQIGRHPAAPGHQYHGTSRRTGYRCQRHW